MAEKKTTKKANDLSFEAASARLNEIVALLEDGGAPLDDSLKLYEEGISLLRHCNALLEAAEAQIKVLTRDASGAIVEKDFAPLTDEG